MNSYERVKAALAGEMPDRRPVMLHNFLMAAKEAGYTMDQYREDPHIIADTFKRAVDKYDYDGILVDIDTVTLAGACGVHVDFPVDDPARSHEGILSSIQDVSKLQKVDISSYKYVQIWCEAVSILKDYYKNEKYIRGNCDQAPFSLATMLRGAENLMMDLCMEDERYTFQLLDYCADKTKQFIKLMKEAGADMVSNGDSPAGPSMISPSMYEKFALPYEKQVIDYAHELGVPYVLHICGNTNQILDLMIESGADGIELDYKTDISMIEEKARGKVVFLGNIDPAGVIALGTPELVTEKTEELLRVYKENPRFILNAGCAIPAMTPPENLMAMLNTNISFK